MTHKPCVDFVKEKESQERLVITKNQFNFVILMSYVVNPKTGRDIKVGGPTYEKLKKSAHYKNKLSHQKSHRKSTHHTKGTRAAAKSLDRTKATHAGHGMGRGGDTRGWSPPRRVSQRRALAEKCGTKCFLKPPTGFPVCDKNCKIDCRGVISARIRAAQNKYKDVESAAKYLERKHCQ